MSEEKGDYHYHHHDEEQPPAAAIQYGTFQGVANYPQPQPAMGFPHPAPPPGHYAQPTSQAHHYAHGYQSSVPGLFKSTLVIVFVYLCVLFDSAVYDFNVLILVYGICGKLPRVVDSDIELIMIQGLINDVIFDLIDYGFV